jgi:arabinan endo-1,5-alpha-L-arabinosidase
MVRAMKPPISPLACLLACLLAACAAGESEDGVDDGEDLLRATALGEVGEYANPIFPSGCADPAVVRHYPSFYLVCTSGGSERAIPIRRSEDLVHWELAGHVFPGRDTWPAWLRGDFWAPEIHRVGNAFVAFYTARSNRTGRPSIGAAWTRSLNGWAAGEGAWTDLGPLVEDEAYGMIDPNYFRNIDGRRYLYWKKDHWQGSDHVSEIYGQELEVVDSGTSLSIRRIGDRVTVLENDRTRYPWEGDLIEGSWTFRKNGRVYMLYGANFYWLGLYVTGVARASSPLGPFEKFPRPILASDSHWKGPGHGSLINVRGRDWFVYHAYEDGRVGNGFPRLPMLDRVDWTSDGWPTIGAAAPSFGTQPSPCPATCY